MIPTIKQIKQNPCYYKEKDAEAIAAKWSAVDAYKGAYEFYVICERVRPGGFLHPRGFVVEVSVYGDVVGYVHDTITP
jgi:hypothetical protein